MDRANAQCRSAAGNQFAYHRPHSRDDRLNVGLERLALSVDVGLQVLEFRAGWNRAQHKQRALYRRRGDDAALGLTCRSVQGKLDQWRDVYRMIRIGTILPRRPQER